MEPKVKEMKREKPKLATHSEISFVPSGCTLLDCALGGGWALGRVANIVGDKSTSKTALATEALINFMIKYPKGCAAYRETEAAFDKDYAASMGLHVNEVDFGDEDNPLLTIEDFARDFDQFLSARVAAKQPGIYVLDSLDALSDEAEMEADISKGTFGVAKARKLSTIFRMMARKTEKSKVLLLIVSQVRENIGVSFGERYRRSGGKALDFYTSQICWLSHIKTHEKTLNKIKRPYGIRIKFKIKKNKVGLPLRSEEFDFIFGYGVDDCQASRDWLKSVGREVPPDMDPAQLASMVREVWAEVDTSFLPERKKYV